MVAGAIALRGLYRLHLARRPFAAFVWTGAAYLPVLVIAATETYVLLILVRLS